MVAGGAAGGRGGCGGDGGADAGKWASWGARLLAVAPPATTGVAVGAFLVPPLPEAQCSLRLSLRFSAARAWTSGAHGDEARTVVRKEAAADVCWRFRGGTDGRGLSRKEGRCEGSRTMGGGRWVSCGEGARLRDKSGRA